MFFYLSKIFWTVAQPSNVIALFLVTGLLFILLGWRKSGLTLAGLGTAAYVLIVTLSAGQLLVAPLENRFPANPALQTSPVGILLFSGPIDRSLTDSRGQISFNDGAERYIEFVNLLNTYPEAKGIVSGGNPSVSEDRKGQADYARLMFDQLGFDTSRIVFEAEARNTYENVINSMQIAKPQPGEKWVLVTSAFHMPRAMGVMKQAGWDVIPYPVDFRSEGTGGHYLMSAGGGEGMSIANLAVKEWIGLIAYYATGKSSAILP